MKFSGWDLPVYHSRVWVERPRVGLDSAGARKGKYLPYLHFLGKPRRVKTDSRISSKNGAVALPFFVVVNALISRTISLFRRKRKEKFKQGK